MIDFILMIVICVVIASMATTFMLRDSLVYDVTLEAERRGDRLNLSYWQMIFMLKCWSYEDFYNELVNN